MAHAFPTHSTDLQMTINSQITNLCSNKIYSSHTRRLLIALLSGSAALVYAQPTGLLYDPEPPVNSGYVRVMSLADTSKMSVLLDGQPRVPSLPKQQPSEYLVVAAGQHQLELVAGRKLVFSTVLNIVRGTFVTVIFVPGGKDPLVFTDKINTNKLKSLLTIYQLTDKSEAVDVLTSDGTIKVFSGLTYGKSNTIQVNPISTELRAIASGTQTSLVLVALSMTQGGAYSVFLYSLPNNKMAALVAENKTERYSGK